MSPDVTPLEFGISRDIYTTATGRPSLWMVCSGLSSESSQHGGEGAEADSGSSAGR